VDGRAKNHEASGALRSAHILVLEDSFLILTELESVLLDAGAEAVWTCRSVKEALRVLAEQDVDAAILDLQLDRETSLPVARALTGRSKSFFFYTGQHDTRALRAEWPECLVVSKPAEPHKIVATVASLIAAE
jgi:DNA-binding response OmpR family regulator